MAEFRIDDERLRGVASTLVLDPQTLHAQAMELSRVVIEAEAGVGGDCPSLRAALDRFRLLGAHGLDVVAEAAAALAGDLFTVAQEAQALERVASQAFVTAGRFGAIE
ncbi:MAG TPA: hypothetical protein VFT81_00055 [Dermatophilaceae bacterium]|nr:hypothetical protein [Dermatophilaceae bacterium]